MGWASAGEIFDPVAQALIDCNASDELKTKVLGTLIGQLQDGDWDTEDESLDAFQNDPAIVTAFREHDVYLACNDSNGPPGSTRCEFELDHVSVHYDGDVAWPRTDGDQ